MLTIFFHLGILSCNVYLYLCEEYLNCLNSSSLENIFIFLFVLVSPSIFFTLTERSFHIHSSSWWLLGLTLWRVGQYVPRKWLCDEAIKCSSLSKVVRLFCFEVHVHLSISMKKKSSCFDVILIRVYILVLRGLTLGSLMSRPAK